MNSDERLIIEGCKQGVRSAQQAVYTRYRPVVYSISLRYLKDADESQDMVQEIFIKLFSKISQFDFKGNFEGWVKRLAVNECLMYLRVKKRMPFTAVDIIPDTSEPESSENQVFSKEQLLTALNSIPESFSIVFSLSVIDEFSHKEIAAQLGIPEETSRSRLHRARLLLQQKLNHLRK